MTKVERNESLSKALSGLLTAYLAGLIPERKWRWIMDVLDSGRLNGRERLEYIAAVNRAIGR